MKRFLKLFYVLGHKNILKKYYNSFYVHEAQHGFSFHIQNLEKNYFMQMRRFNGDIYIFEMFFEQFLPNKNIFYKLKQLESKYSNLNAAQQ